MGFINYSLTKLKDEDVEEQWFSFQLEEFDETKRVIRNRKSKKEGQYNGQKDRQTTIYKTLHWKLKIE